MATKRRRDDPCPICLHHHNVTAYFYSAVDLVCVCVVVSWFLPAWWQPHRWTTQNCFDVFGMQYHEGQKCAQCGHVKAVVSVNTNRVSLKPVYGDFLFLGSYDDSSRDEHLKSLGVTHVLNVCDPSVALNRTTLSVFSAIVVSVPGYNATV